MIFKIITDYGIKHAILNTYIEKYQETETFKNTGVYELDYALGFNFIPNLFPNKEFRNRVIGNLKSLCVSGHFSIIKKDGENYIMMTKKGLDTYNSEEYIALQREEKRKIINNRYTIAFGVITAIGVLWSLGLSLKQGKDKSQQQVLKIIIEQPAKRLPLHQDSSIVDSAKISP